MSEVEWNNHLLKSANPFSKIISRTPWDESPDVERVNGDIHNQVLSLLEEAKENQNTKMMLIQGQPGVGKTHFLSRLRRLSRNESFLFVSIKPISSVTSIFSHIYREIFTSLRKREKGEQFNSMEILISNIISSSFVKAIQEKRGGNKLSPKLKKLIDKLEKNPTLILSIIDHDKSTMKLFEPLTEIAINNVERDYPEVDLTFLKVLFKTLNPKLRLDAMRWLQGDDIDDDKLASLNVKISISDENFAQRVLYSVMILSNQSLLLCFDQLESIYDRFHDVSVLTRFFDILLSLCNETPNALILLMIQTHVWSEQVYPIIPVATLDRIEFRESLVAPNNIEMVEIVSKRLNLAWNGFPFLPKIRTYPFSESYITDLSKELGWNPRYVLRQLSKEFQYMKTNKDFKLLTEFFLSKTEDDSSSEMGIGELIDNHLKNIISQYKESIDSSSYITRENYLIAGLFDLFKGLKDTNKAHNNFLIVEVSFKKRASELDIEIEYKNKDNSISKLGIEICNNERGFSFNAALKRIKKHMDNKTIDRWIMIRDSELPVKKSWKKSVELLISLEESGSLIFIDIEDDATIYACKELLDLSGAGDLNINNTILTRNETLDYLLDNIIESISIFNSIFSQKETKIEPTKIQIKTTKRDNKETIKNKIIEQASNNMMVSINKFFADFDLKLDMYKEIVEELVNESKLIYIINKESNVVVSKPASEDIF